MIECFTGHYRLKRHLSIMGVITCLGCHLGQELLITSGVIVRSFQPLGLGHHFIEPCIVRYILNFASLFLRLFLGFRYNRSLVDVPSSHVFLKPAFSHKSQKSFTCFYFLSTLENHDNFQFEINMVVSWFSYITSNSL